ncbi:MAG: hypothetical protein U0132_14565 [Gemmatimonadaceae bacterium]
MTSIRAATPAAQPATPQRPKSSRSVEAFSVPAPRAAPRQRQAPSSVPVILIVGILAAVNAWGIPYYLSDQAARVRNPLHDWLKASGYVGQSAGILALIVFIFLWLYPLRKKWKKLAFTGSIGKWLDVHVTTAIGLPLLLTIHAAWRSDGVIGLGFDAMLVVCASGVVGRYLYTRIPRTRTGVELTRDEVAKKRKELVAEIAEATGLTSAAIEQSLDVGSGAQAGGGAWSALTQLVTNDVRRWRLSRELPKRWASLAPNAKALDPQRMKKAVRLASREIALTQQSNMLDATHKLFRFWHVAHRPFALTALVAVIIHVTVVVALGSTWFY